MTTKLRETFSFVYVCMYLFTYLLVYFKLCTVHENCHRERRKPLHPTNDYIHKEACL